MRNLMENHALEMGIGGDIFQAPFQQLKECITDTWFKSTLEFISENDITIDSPMAQLQLWRTGDTFLTADAIEAGMSGKDLAAINRCRMHLKATTLSDITIARPTRLTMDAYDVVFQEEIPIIVQEPIDGLNNHDRHLRTEGSGNNFSAKPTISTKDT